MCSRMPCCCCCSRRSGVLVTGVVSVLMSLVTALPMLYVLVKQDAWVSIYNSMLGWLKNHFIKDTQATSAVISLLDWLAEDSRYQLVLAGLVSAITLHLFSALLLILGAMLQHRALLLPWLITDILILIVMASIFIGWTFLSFFVDLLVAIMFPIIGGTVLGFWIYSWRNVQDLFNIYGLRCRILKQDEQEERRQTYSLVPKTH